jgi:hypothetical protein
MKIRLLRKAGFEKSDISRLGSKWVYVAHLKKPVLLGAENCLRKLLKCNQNGTFRCCNNMKIRLLGKAGFEKSDISRLGSKWVYVSHLKKPVLLCAENCLRKLLKCNQNGWSRCRDKKSVQWTSLSRKLVVPKILRIQAVTDSLSNVIG